MRLGLGLVIVLVPVMACTAPRPNDDLPRDGALAAGAVDAARLDGQLVDAQRIDAESPADAQPDADAPVLLPCDSAPIVACRQDLDEDGWGGGPPVEDCFACPDGWVYDTGGPLDCHDDDARVRPDQVEFFSAPYVREGASSFDYDCDGRETARLELFVTGTPCSGCTAGWIDPVCGEMSTYRTCRARPDEPCPGDLARMVRCR